ncbi:EfeM/EfeO family lipoprotein [Neisseriaceae bacterium ESL0693]|nr:EfeM/EfeO family lipoprotein [Neisseriaceae bacterium ESL0693]
MKQRGMNKIGVMLLCIILPAWSAAHGLRAPIINDQNAVLAKGDIPTPVKYEAAIHAYLAHVQTQLQHINQQLSLIVSDTKKPSLTAARQSYIRAHQQYERIRPIVALFGNVNQNINSRASDYLQGVEDPRFTGFHLLEYELFRQQNPAKAHEAAVNLQYEIQDLQKRVALDSIDAAKMVQAAADFMELILNGKLAGQENRFSHSDLADIDGNIEGAADIVHYLAPFIPQAQLRPIEAGFQDIRQVLAPYRLPGQQYQPFGRLSRADHDRLYSLVTTQADRLAQLRAILNIRVYYQYPH